MREAQMKRVPCRQFVIPVAVALLAAVSGLVSPASAQTFSSSYTSTAPKDCRTVGKAKDNDGGATQVCPGKSGLVVVSEDDLRQTISVGATPAAAAKEPAANVWFAPSIPRPIPSNGGRRTNSPVIKDEAKVVGERGTAVGLAKR